LDTVCRTFVSLSLCLALGCFSPSRNVVLVDVPFIPQTASNHCGVVALAMALDYYSLPYDIHELTNEAFIPFLGGSTMLLLADVAAEHGLSVSRQESNLPALHTTISEKQLPLIYLAPEENSGPGHFALVTGVSDNLRHVRIHGTTKPDRWIRASRLPSCATNTAFPSLVLSQPLRDTGSGIPLRENQGNPDGVHP